MEVSVPCLTAYVTLVALSVMPCRALEMRWVPTSISVTVGGNTKIPCNFTMKSERVDVSWTLIQKKVTKTQNNHPIENVFTPINSSARYLPIINAQKNHSGLYKCRVTVNGSLEVFTSCGTYLRVKEPPVYLFFNISEATKNKVITAEGIVLLLCAIIPGTLLLYKKRLDNMASFSLKQSEGENLYEGLNLEDCSMYEDISRGLQATYEDVGTLREGIIQLERP